MHPRRPAAVVARGEAAPQIEMQIELGGCELGARGVFGFPPAQTRQQKTLSGMLPDPRPVASLGTSCSKDFVRLVTAPQTQHSLSTTLITRSPYKNTVKNIICSSLVFIYFQFSIFYVKCFCFTFYLFMLSYFSLNNANKYTSILFTCLFVQIIVLRVLWTVKWGIIHT